MKTLGLLLVAALVVAAGCGGDETPSGGGQRSEDVAMSGDATEAGMKSANRDAATAARDQDATGKRKGTTVRIRNSPFGRMLFDSRRQAIYIFQNDRKGKTVCYGECARAWPPVLTRGEPVAGKGVDADLLGTIERRNGTRQVTYAGQPLYYYANEGRGEVRCHNVNLNGGFWWVIGPNGKRRP